MFQWPLSRLKIKPGQRSFCLLWLGILFCFSGVVRADPVARLLIPETGEPFRHYAVAELSRCPEGAAQFSAFLVPAGKGPGPGYRVKGIFPRKAGNSWILQLHGWPDIPAGTADIIIEMKSGNQDFRLRLPDALQITRHHVDVVLMVDSSHSMRHIDPEGLGIKAALGFARIADERGDVESISVVSFNDSADILLPPVAADDQTIIAEVIASLDPGGQTDMDRGFSLAEDVHERLQGNKKIALFVSDGRNSPARYQNGHVLFARRKWPVYTVGYSDQIETGILVRISKETGGRFLFNPTETDIAGVFHEVAPTPRLKIKIEDFRLTPNQSVLFPVDDSVRSLTVEGADEHQFVVMSPTGIQMEGPMEIYRPARGEWQITAKENPASIEVTAETDLVLVPFPVIETPQTETPLELACLLIRDNKPVPDAQIQVSLIIPGDDGETSLFLDDGDQDGIFTGSVVPASAGKYHGKVMAQGLTPAGFAFKRMAEISFEVTLKPPPPPPLPPPPPPPIAEILLEPEPEETPEVEEAIEPPIIPPAPPEKDDFGWLRLLLIIILILAILVFFIRWLIKSRERAPRMLKYFTISAAVHALLLFLALDLLVETGVVEVRDISPALAVRIRGLEEAVGFNITPSGGEISVKEKETDTNIAKPTAEKSAENKQDAEKQENHPEKAQMAAKTLDSEAEMLKETPELEKKKAEQSRIMDKLAMEEAKFKGKQAMAEKERKVDSEKSELEMKDMKSGADARPEETEAEKRETAKLALEMNTPEYVAEQMRLERQAVTRQQELKDRLSVEQLHAVKPVAQEKDRQIEAAKAQARSTQKKQDAVKPETSGPGTAKMILPAQTAKARTAEIAIESQMNTAAKMTEPKSAHADFAVKRQASDNKASSAPRQMQVALRNITSVEQREVSSEFPEALAPGGQGAVSRTAEVKTDIPAGSPGEYEGSELNKTQALKSAGPSDNIKVETKTAERGKQGEPTSRSLEVKEQTGQVAGVEIKAKSDAAIPGPSTFYSEISKPIIEHGDTGILTKTGVETTKERISPKQDHTPEVGSVSVKKAGKGGSDPVPSALAEVAREEIKGVEAAVSHPLARPTGGATAKSAEQELSGINVPGAKPDKLATTPEQKLSKRSPEKGPDVEVSIASPTGKKTDSQTTRPEGARQVEVSGAEVSREDQRKHADSMATAPLDSNLHAVSAEDSPQARKDALSSQLRFSIGDGSQQTAKIKIGLAKYQGGDWDSSGSAMMYLAHQIEDRTGMALEASDKVVSLSSPDLMKMPFVYMTGHKNFVFTPSEIQNLGKYLRAGGYLWADDSTDFTDDNFDAAFRREIKRVLPEAGLERLDDQFPAFKTGYDLTKGYRGYRIPPGDKYRLDYIEGIRIGNRTAVVYTRNDYGDGLNIDPNTHPLNPSLTDLSPEEMQEGAIQMGINLVLYFLTRRPGGKSDFARESGLKLGDLGPDTGRTLPKGEASELKILEKPEGWRVEEWSDGAAIKKDKNRFEISFSLDKNKKIAITRDMDGSIILSTADIVAMDVNSHMRCGSRMAIGIGTGEDYVESQPFYIKPGRNQVFFRMSAKTFKSARTDWEYREALKGALKAERITLLIYSPEAGRIDIENTRLIKEK